MYRLDREEFLRRPFLLLWALLGFQAGCINSFGFLTCQKFVSHVTGFGTQVGIALSEGRFAFALELIGVPLFFIFGSFVNGLLTISRIEQGKVPLYVTVTAAIPILLTTTAFAGYYGWFGVFGENLSYLHDFVLLYTLCFVCGMQNGCFATMTRGQIRTTHLTGISTDLGTDLSRTFFGKQETHERTMMLKANFSRIATFLGFSGGAIVSATLDLHLGYLALLIPATSACVALAVVLHMKHRADIKTTAHAH